jgi:Predicted thioesterase
MPRSDDWDIDAPFVTAFKVGDEHIDRLEHMNNAVYLTFMEQAAWHHTEALGIGWQTYVDLDAVCVVHRHELDYLMPAYHGDELEVATWIAENDGRLKMWRAFQMRRTSDGRTIFRARSQYVTVKMSNGRACRMPQSFVGTYRAAPATKAGG